MGVPSLGAGGITPTPTGISKAKVSKSPANQKRSTSMYTPSEVTLSGSPSTSASVAPNGSSDGVNEPTSTTIVHGKNGEYQGISGYQKAVDDIKNGIIKEGEEVKIRTYDPDYEYITKSGETKKGTYYYVTYIVENGKLVYKQD